MIAEWVQSKDEKDFNVWYALIMTFVDIANSKDIVSYHVMKDMKWNENLHQVSSSS